MTILLSHKPLASMMVTTKMNIFTAVYISTDQGKFRTECFDFFINKLHPCFNDQI